MTKIKSILWLFIALLSVPPLLYGENLPDKWYTGTMQPIPMELQQVGDSLYIRICYDFNEIKVSSNHSIELIPVLITTNRQMELPEISVKGRNNYRSLNRKLALMSAQEHAFYEAEAPYDILKGYGKAGKVQIRYSLVIPFESWMKDARLDVKQEVMGCCKPGKLLSAFPLFGAIALEKPPVPYQIVPHVSYVKPEVEPVKRREMSCEAFLDFIVSKTNINADYMNNPAELKKISDMIEEVRNDTNIAVRGIWVTGFASPEGSSSLNRQLSERRAQALVNYLFPRFSFSKELYKVEYGGENWLGLCKMVAESEMAEKDDILSIIDHASTQINDMKLAKRELMSYKQGKPYIYMLHQFYPHLRKAICKIDYNVQNFDVEQAKVQIHTRPQDLSLNEMYMVALTYEKGSLEFIELFKTAVRIFPDDKTANLNAALAALSCRDTVLAERYLQKAAADIPEYDNAMGVLYLLKEDYRQARLYLEKAAHTGMEQAKLNLQELELKQKNNRLIKEKNN